MHDTEEEDTRPPGPGLALSVPRTPPLRLAGIDEDDTGEPNVVRGID
ncbi:hypothetical protein [Streptomyces sp. NPDC020607]